MQIIVWCLDLLKDALTGVKEEEAQSVEVFGYRSLCVLDMVA